MFSVAGVATSAYYTGGGSGCGASVHAETASDYYADGENGEPAGRFVYRGEDPFGLAGEIRKGTKNGRAFARMVDHLEHPETGAPLGRRAQRFKTVKERVREYRRKHPRATKEQVNEKRLAYEKDQREAKNAWDLTFSLPKSWSVLHAAYLREGRTEDAAKLIEAAEFGIHVALDQLAEELAFTRHGVAGPKDPATGKVTTEHRAAAGIQFALFWHHVSRENDPQLHAHVAMINRVLDAFGDFRALYSPAFTKSKHMIDATFLRSAEARATELLGLAFMARPDGKAREIVGVSEEVREHFSSRSRKLTEDAQEMVDAYTAKYGTAPSARHQWKILQWANKKSRRAKPAVPLSPEERLELWEESLAAQDRASLGETLVGVDLSTLGEQLGEVTVDRDAVVLQALADIEQRKATANRSHLWHAISQRLPDMLGVPSERVRDYITELTDWAERSEYVVSTEAAPVVEVPRSLRDPRTGRSRWEAPHPGRFTTREHLAREDSLVERLDHRGAPTLPAGTVEALLRGTTVGVDQRRVLTEVLAGGRRLETIDARAGSGKSFLIKTLADIYEQTRGARPTVLTLSENAAEVVRGEGVHQAHNIPKWLTWRERQLAGKTGLVEDAELGIDPRAPVVIDEASMVDTPRMTKLLAHLDDLGVQQVILVGDRAQVDSVDAGGGFAMLLDEREARGETVHHLETVRRFSQVWEAEASAALRERDVTALAQYEARRRITGGPDAEQVQAAAAAGFLTDYLSGRDTVVVTATTEEADQVADRIRAELAARGHVERDGVQLRNETRAGVGDLVQTRENNRDLGVVNRKRWEVVGRHDDGALDVRPLTGRDRTPLTLPAGYVREQVELAYASTVEAVQGRTTDTAHVLATPTMGFSQLYAAGTRGRDGNWYYVQTEQSPELERARALVSALEHRLAAEQKALPPAPTAAERDAAAAVQAQWTSLPGEPEHVAVLRGRLDEARAALGEVRARAQSPVGRLAQAVAEDDHQVAARTEIAAEQARQQSLAHLGPQWEAGVRETRAADHRDDVLAALGNEAPLVLEDPRSSRLFAELRQAELKGHDPREVMARVMYRQGRDGPEWWTLAGTRSPASALYGRVAKEVANGPITNPKPVTFERRVPEVERGSRENERRQVTREFGRAMDERTTALAWKAAEEQPEWATRALGPVPTDPGARGGWIGRVAHAAAFREMYGWHDERRALPGPPSHLEPEKSWLWNMAAQMIGVPEHERDLQARSTGELLNGVQAWERQLAALPANNDEELADTHGRLREVEARIVDARTAGEDTAALEAAREVWAERVNVLEENALIRAWGLDEYRPLADRAEDYQRELDRRAEVERTTAGEPLPEEPDELDGEPEFEEPVDDLAALRAVHERLTTRDTEGPLPERLPEVGSAAFLALPDSDPAKQAATAQAAAAWWNLGAPVDRELADLRERLDDAAAVVGTSPDRDLDLDQLTGMHDWSARNAGEGELPAYGSPAWATADREVQAQAEARAAMAWWNVGDPLPELRERTHAAEDRAASIEISRDLAGQLDRMDSRSYAEVQRARGEEPSPANLRGEREVAADVHAGRELRTEEPPRADEPWELAEPTRGPWPLPATAEGPNTGATPEPAEEPPGPAPADPVAEPVDEATDPAPAAVPAVPAAPEPATAPELAEDEPEPAAAVEDAEPAADEAEERFQEGLAWSLAQARELEEAKAEPTPDVEEPAAPDPEPEPDPEPATAEPAPVWPADDPVLSGEREKAGATYEQLVGDHDPGPDTEPAPDPEPVDSEPAPALGDDR